MDRGRRGSLLGSSDPRKRGKPLPPVSERSSAGPHGQMIEPQSGRFGEMIEPQKFGGSMVPGGGTTEDKFVIDPNLLVGPLYTGNTERSTGRMKEQLTDITEKLHKTLHSFDEFADFEPGEDPLVGMMKKKIMEVEDPNMQFQLSGVMDQYEDMAQQLKDANSERDDMLLQLADWFTTDHVDLEDIKTSIDDTDEEHIKRNYFDTMTNFEKLKKLQMKIADASTKGKPTRQLERKKVELERDVVDKFKIMKDMSMQTMKLKISDDAPWKHAANEIVSMLKNVRSENAEELAAIHKNMKDMIDQLEKQALTIKSLTAELREKKEIVKTLTDENGDLSQDMALLQARLRRYEKDLDAAKKMIRSLHQAQTEGGAPPPILDDVDMMGMPMQQTISNVLAKFDERKEPEFAVKRLGSDPALLRTQIRDLQDDMDLLREDYDRKNEDLTEMAITLQEKREYIESIEAENEKFSKELKKLRAQRRQSLAQPPAEGQVVPPIDAGPEKDYENLESRMKNDILKQSNTEFKTPKLQSLTKLFCRPKHFSRKFQKAVEKHKEEIEELKNEVKKWQDKCNYFKKVLADTELKLSDAYKEISDLRMDRDTVPTPAPKAAEKVKTKDAPPSKEPAKGKEEPTEPVKPESKKPKTDKPKPERTKPETKPRYLQQSKKGEMKLPPIEKSQAPEEQKIEPKTASEKREYNLYRVGDLQGKLNMLSNEIMEFVAEIGKMLYKDKEETKKIQTITAFSFDNNQKKEKEIADPKEQEAKQKRSQVLFLGQHALSKLREAFDMLSNSLGLQHNEYEAIYRSFKISQQRQAIRSEIIHGRLPVTALQDFDQQMQSDHKKMLGEHGMLAAYYNISYGGGAGGMQVSNKPRTTGLHRKSSSVLSIVSDSPETESKLKETMHVLSMQRSKSDLDVRPPEAQGMGGSLHGAGMMRERDSIFLGQVPEAFRHESLAQSNKQEVKISKAVVPRKGLIKLSTTQDEQGFNLNVLGEKQGMPSHESPHLGSGKQQTSLIRRKDILEQIKQGTKLLEEYEQHQKEEEEMTKSLGEYTMLDLQSHILGMTDARSLKRQKSRNLMKSPVPPNRDGPLPPGANKDKKGVTLPSINTLNLF